MFGNFLYFIVVLLIYVTYQPLLKTDFSGLETIGLFFGIILFYFYFTSFLFRRLEKRIANSNFAHIDSQFHAIVMRQSIMAILIFFIDIYLLNLPAFLIDIPIFNTIPTLQTTLFLGLFVFYLGLVWTCAHGAYKKLYGSDISPRAYVWQTLTSPFRYFFPGFYFQGFAILSSHYRLNGPAVFLTLPKAGRLTFSFF